MDVKQLKKAVLLCREAKITPFIWGQHGIGKSQSISQISDEEAIGFIDLRCSQMEASDLRGLPDRENGRTIYLPPDELPHGEFLCLSCGYTFGTIDDDPKDCPECGTGEWLRESDESNVSIKGTEMKRSLARRYFTKALKTKAFIPTANDEDIKTAFLRFQTETTLDKITVNEGILFLDELNRAEDDVLQAAFQLVYDRKIGSYQMPKGWGLVVAGNYASGYNVNNFEDPAFLDRFCHLELFANNDTYAQSWVEYMADKPHANKITQFATYAETNLTGKKIGEKEFSIQPSPRSWELVSKILSATEKITVSHKVKMEVLAGLIGIDLASSFEEFSCKVTPEEIISKGMKPLKPILDSLSRGEMTGLIFATAPKARDKRNKNVTKNILEFVEWLCSKPTKGQTNKADMAVAFCRSLVSGDGEDKTGLDTALMSNIKLANLVSKLANKNSNKQFKNSIFWIKAIQDYKPTDPTINLQKLIQDVSWGI